MKTIDITAKEWFDKVNGNSYFSARIIIDYSLPTEQTIYLPFQYGYGDHYQDIAVKELQELNLLPSEDKYFRLWQVKDLGILLRYNKIDKQLKRDVVSFGKL